MLKNLSSEDIKTYLHYNNFYARAENEKRIILTLPNDISLFCLINNSDLLEIENTIKQNIDKYYKCFYDNSGRTLGKKYVRSGSKKNKYIKPSSLICSHFYRL